MRVLLHLRENRIFYFMVGAGLLVLVVMLQIRTAYRAYDDNERLVKLWVQEKELKDIMSHKTQLVTEDPHPSLEATRNRSAHKPTLDMNEAGYSVKEAALHHGPDLNTRQAIKPPSKTSPPPPRISSPNRNARPIAGIVRAQV
jgi:hypothetical protein